MLLCSTQSHIHALLFKIPGGKHLMDLVAVDWFKNTKRMDNVGKRSGCAAQVSFHNEISSITD